MSFSVMASGDHHFDEHSPRWAECLRIHRWIADQVRERQPSALVSTGDIYERASTPKEREAVAAWLTSIADVCPVLVVRGNHDAKQDCAILARLKARHEIRVEEGAGVHILGGVAIAACAWPSRASLASLRGQLGEGVEQDASEALTAVMRGLGLELGAFNGPKVLAAHAMVDGSVTSVGQPLIGAEMRVGLDVLGMARADVTLLGHIHAPQAWTWGNAQTLYCGSPFRTSFGEVEEKSIVRVTFAGGVGGGATVHRIPTPASKMVLAEGVFDGEVMVGGVDLHGLARGDEARFRYKVRADHRDAAKRAVKGLREAADAVGLRLKIEEDVTPVTRAKAPQIAKANTLADKLDVLWASRSTVPANDVRSRLFDKLSTLTG